MSRRLQACRLCPPGVSGGKFTRPRGFTRHKDRICSQCRAQLRYRHATRLTFLPNVDNVHAPTMEELSRGIPLGGLLAPYPFSWRGRGA